MNLKYLNTLLFVWLSINFSLTQVKLSELTNKKGETYDYYKGDAYYKDILYTGGVEEYISDSIIWSRKSYLNGEPNGYAIYYFENGTPWCIGLIINREKQGKWVFYRRNGEIQGIEEFKDGYLISEPITIDEQP